MTVEEPIVFDSPPQEPPSQGPRPFSEIAGLWPRPWEMTEEFFRREITRTSVPNTLYGVLIFAILTTLISAFTLPLSSSRATLQELASLLNIGNTTAMAGMVVSLSLCGIITAPIFFYINNGVYYLCAQIFGGKGQFAQQAYLNSLYLVPFGVLSALGSLLGLIPFIGFFISLPFALVIMVFQLVITVRMLKAVHELSTGKVVGVILLPLVLVIIPICLVLTLALMGPGIGSVFSTIISLTTTPMP